MLKVPPAARKGCNHPIISNPRTPRPGRNSRRGATLTPHERLTARAVLPALSIAREGSGLSTLFAARVVQVMDYIEALGGRVVVDARFYGTLARQGASRAEVNAALDCLRADGEIDFDTESTGRGQPPRLVVRMRMIDLPISTGVA